MALFGLLAAGHVEKNAEHDTVDDAGVGALATSRDPPKLVTQHDAEIDLVSPSYRSRRRKSGPDAVPVGRMDMPRKAFKGDLGRPGQAPKVKGALVHGEAIAVDVP